MYDVFKEQLIKKRPNQVDMLKRAGVIALVIIITLAAFWFIPQFALLVLAVACIGAYFLFTFLNIEYEYSYTNGDLDIDIIYSKSRRKRIFSGSVKEFDIMCRVNDKAHTQDFRDAEVKDYSSGVMSGKCYAFLTNYKGKRLKVIIEPNETMLEAISAAISKRKFFV